MENKIVMGYWDCPSCGSTGIPGTTYDCPNCGRQRGKETKFYMREGKVEYVPGHVVKGADWYCEYCGALNSAERTTCENCGSPKEESKDNYFSLKEPKPEINNSNHKDEVQTSIEKVSKLKTSKIKLFGILAIALLMIFLISSYVHRPKKCTFEVKEMSWSNSIEIEENCTFRESDWYLPSGGRLAYTNSEIRSYQSVVDHYETVTKSRQVESGGHYETSYSDNGDGTFTEESTYVPDYTTEYYTEDEPVYREEPIYDTKYYYDIDKWVYDRTETAEGNDKNTYWPTINLSDKEREAGRYTIYVMSGVLNYKSFGKNKKEDETYGITDSMWKEIEVGQTLNITIQDGVIKEWEPAH